MKHYKFYGFLAMILLKLILFKSIGLFHISR